MTHYNSLYNFSKLYFELSWEITAACLRYGQHINDPSGKIKELLNKIQLDQDVVYNNFVAAYEKKNQLNEAECSYQSQ